MNKVVAAAVQCSPVLYSREGTVNKLCDWIQKLGKEGVELAVFGETLVPYYPYFSFIQAPYAMGKQHLQLMEESVVVPSDATEKLAEAARAANMVVAVGVNEKDGGTLYNAQLLFDADGMLVQHRRKITPTYSPAGNTTTPWPATRLWRTEKKFTLPCFPAPWLGIFSQNKLKLPFATTP